MSDITRYKGFVIWIETVSDGEPGADKVYVITDIQGREFVDSPDVYSRAEAIRKAKQWIDTYQQE